MFKFNFCDNGENEESCPNKTISIENTTKIAATSWRECEEIKLNQVTLLDKIVSDSSAQNLKISEDTDLTYLSPNNIIDILRGSNLSNLDILAADKDQSDLLSSRYEGGVKIWECTFDMIDFIHNTNICLDNKRILDLGCGAGIIGILCMLKGASCCFFQDYNSDVIKYFTIPTVKLNLKDKTEHCKFFSGDWKSFAQILSQNLPEDQKFDYIFAVETIYNTDCYEKLHDVFESLLKTNGKVYLGAKSYYFGVGGGISLFQDFLELKNTFAYTVCKQFTEGVKREILEIKFKDT